MALSCKCLNLNCIHFIPRVKWQILLFVPSQFWCHWHCDCPGKALKADCCSTYSQAAQGLNRSMNHGKTFDLIDTWREEWKAVTWLSAFLKFLKHHSKVRERWKNCCGSPSAQEPAPSSNLSSAVPGSGIPEAEPCRSRSKAGDKNGFPTDKFQIEDTHHL